MLIVIINNNIMKIIYNIIYNKKYFELLNI